MPTWTSLTLSIFFFKLLVYALVGLASAAFLVVLRRRLRQRCLRNVSGPSNPSFVWGHWRHMFNPYAYMFYEGLYRTHGKVARVYGFFGDIQLVVSDPKACNNIIVKEQAIFEETEVFRFTSFQIHLIHPLILSPIQGAHHRRQRRLLNPVFNVNHMRYLTPIFYGVTRQLRDKFRSIVENGPQEINVADWTGRIGLELIGQAGFGYSFGTLESRNDEFCRVLKEWVPALASLGVYRNLFPYVYKIFHPKILKFVGRMLPWPGLNHLMNLAEAMNAQARGVYETKKRLLESGDDATAKQVGEGKDLISLLMQASVAVSEDDRLSEEEVVAQIMGLLVAGTDTTSTALSCLLHQLALHPNVQDKLRKELEEACQDNEELTHDQLVSLPFLEAVCRETLRLYPPLPGVMRTARSDAILPLSAPIHDVDGRKIHEVFVPANTDVFVQIHHLNRDPSIWGPDGAEWKPERWLAPLPESVTNANIQGVYANTMTFIGGGRSCIGFKFAQLEMKVVLSQIVPAFRFAPTKAAIIWRFGGISSPSVEGSVHLLPPKLPIMISRV
ncbi:cytochrome P450 [Lactarius pseudohatsudake]|nr:cytochrome P450 [Lactarius pseudohatsudake]